MTDPIRPYAYVDDGGADIRVYNVFTGQLEGTFPGVAAALGSLTVSSDGSRLFAADLAQSEVVPIDRGSAYDMECYDLDFDADSGGLEVGAAVAGESIGDWGVGSNGQDIALSVDGSLAFVASGSPYNFRAYDSSGAVVGILAGDAYPNNVEVTDQGVTLAGASVSYGPADVWLYALDGSLLASHKMSGYMHTLRPRQLKASGDGTRLVALTDEPTLAFVTAVP